MINQCYSIILSLYNKRESDCRHGYGFLLLSWVARSCYVFFYLEIMLFHIRWSMCCYCWKDNKTIMSLIWGRHSNFFITVTKIKKKSFNISCGICNVLYFWIVAMAIPRCFKIPSQCISPNKHTLKLGHFNSFKWIWQFFFF